MPAAMVAKVSSSINTKLPVMRSASYGSTANGVAVRRVTTPMSFSRSSVASTTRSSLTFEDPGHLLDHDGGDPRGVLDPEAVPDGERPVLEPADGRFEVSVTSGAPSAAAMRVAP